MNSVRYDFLQQQIPSDDNNNLNTGEPTSPQQQCDPATDTNCSSEPTVPVCPDGSVPDATGKCPEAATGHHAYQLQSVFFYCKQDITTAKHK
jgi:hypothetical protein